MSFLSLAYWLFLAGIVAIYWTMPRRAQNALLLAGSLGFAASFGMLCVAVLLVTSCLDYWLSQGLHWDRPQHRRRVRLWLSVFLNLGTLAFFRFAHGAVVPSQALAQLGIHLDAPTIQIIGPLGVSFYTLQRLGYSFDVYNKTLHPCRKLSTFVLFATFFPALTAGPIERAHRILPQLDALRRFELTRFYQATWLFSLGMFEKVFLADRSAELADTLLGQHPGGLTTVFGIYAYAIQLFADFAGYSNMARGSAGFLGIDLRQNFDAPYLSPNLSEYWKRWHISLSSWLDDYVYKPSMMALRGFGTLGNVGAILLTFAVSGLWHGTGLTFMAWAAIHGVGVSVVVATRTLRKRLRKRLPGWPYEVAATLITFHYVCVGYVFFRAESLSAAFHTLASLAAKPNVGARLSSRGVDVIIYLVTALVLQHMQRKDGELWPFSQPVWVRAVCYTVLLFCVLRLPGHAEHFVYAQF